MNRFRFPNRQNLGKDDNGAAAVERRLAFVSPAPVHPARNGAAAPARARR